MPKVPIFTLAWSSVTETYDLHATRNRESLRIVPGSSEWFVWLEQIPSFAFVGKSGHFTARKEVKQRGGRYWYAYQAAGERLSKKYLGKTSHLTLSRLEDIASVLDAQSAARTSPPMPPVGETSSEGESTRGSILSPPPHPLHRLLPTKLHVPRPRTHLIHRAHLVERLRQGTRRALTLVSAPAGFGKTTLLAQWLAESGMPAAWLSLEAEDNDPTRFLSYMIAALQTLDERLGVSALALLRTPQPPAAEAVLAMLINDLVERSGGDIALVLDDYHVITAEPIQRGITFLLEHLPPQLHLILATRADPPLPLARLRAGGQLSEVRTTDLRFATAETGTFLQAVMGLELEASDVATLEQRTEGWIAGLQLAALSLQGRADVSAFLSAFSGTHRYVLDYLSEEVLARQPEPVQQFLLNTSILERLSGPLCDAVVGQEGSQALLETLDKANLLVVALDDERHWYRYHHLFAEVLRRHLQQRQPTLPPVLHRRASAWYEQHDLPSEAIQHALAVPDFELAARLIEPIAIPATLQGQIYTVLGWISALPEALMSTRPQLCVDHASLLLFTNQLVAVESRLQMAERYAQSKMDTGQARIIVGRVLALRGSIAGYVDDIARSVSLSQQALELLPEAEVPARVGAIVTAAHAYRGHGVVTPATEREVAAADAFIRTTGNSFAAVRSITLLARLYVLQGRLRQAAATYAQVEQLVPRPEILHTFFSSLYYYFCLGDLLRERNELEAAERHLAQGMALVKEALTVEPFVALLGYTTLARLHQARGDPREALATLDALARLAEQRRFPQHLQAQGAAIRAQLELAQGNLAAAMRWADGSGLSTEDEEVPYLSEGEYLALARVRIAQAHSGAAAPFLQQVLSLLDRLLRDAAAKARTGSVLEILVLRALALEARGDRAGALPGLERALALAAPEGYTRLFVDEGAPMLTLLRQAQAHSTVPGYIITLLAAFGEAPSADRSSSAPGSQRLLEPLTEREREVLRLLLEGASNREIARRLVLSVNTVKRHVYNLCRKLGVQSRTQIIARARTLNLS